MTELHRKLSNLAYDFSLGAVKNGLTKDEQPVYFEAHPFYFVDATVRFHEDDSYQNVTFLITQDEKKQEEGFDRSDIFYVCNTIGELPALLANIDFVRDSFDSDEEFESEVNKYDDGDEFGIIPDDADYRLYDNLEDFCIVDIKSIYFEK